MTARKIIIYPLLFFFVVSVTYVFLFYFFPTKKNHDQIFVKVQGFWDPQVFEPLKKEFQKENPQIAIEYEQKNPERYFSNLKADLDKSNGADVFWWHSGWGPEIKNNLDPLPQSLYTNKAYENTFYPVTKTDMKVDGTYRGLPLEIDGLALLYNKSIFASLNLPPPSASWPTIREEDIRPLTNRDSKRILSSAIALGSEDNIENFPEIVGLFLMQNGVQFITNKQLVLAGKVNQDNRGINLTADAIDFYYYFSKSAQTWDSTQPNDIEAFAKGKVAMIILPAYKIHTLLNYMREQNFKVDFNVAPVPQLPPPYEQVSWGSYWSLGVNSNSKEKEASWKFANFLTSENSLREVFNLESKLNDFGRAYPRVSMAKEQTTNPFLAAYLTQAPYAKSWYLNSDTFDNGLNDQLIAALKQNLTKVENGSVGVDILDRLSSSINPILKKYGLVDKEAAKKNK